MLVTSTEKRALFNALMAEGQTRQAADFCRELLDAAAGDERTRWTNNLSMALYAAGDYRAALDQLNGTPAESSDHKLLGNRENNKSACHLALWKEEEDEAHLDAAAVGFEGATYHYELAAEPALVASAVNNTAALYVATGRPAEALPLCERARSIYLRDSEPFKAAIVDETEARARLALGEVEQAERLAARAVSALSCSGEVAALGQARETLRAIWSAR